MARCFYDFTTRVIYDNSRVHEDNEQMQFYEGKLNHIWVDLFIIDRLPESRFGAFFRQISSEGGVRHGHCPQGSDRLFQDSLADKIRVGTLSAAGRLVPMPVLFRLQTALAAKDRNKRTGKTLLQQLSAGFSLCDAGRGLVRKDGGSAL